MNALRDLDTDQLIRSAAEGDDQAKMQLLQRHRSRLRKLVAIRLDSRLSSRIDPSDVVQEGLVVAHQRLDDYVHAPQIAFYPWLRKIILNCMTDLYRHHLKVGKRSIEREFQATIGVNEESAMILAGQFAAPQSSPSGRLMRTELKNRVLNALQSMPFVQREIIVMRHLEEMPVKEIAAVLDIPAGSVMSRHFRGMKALRRLLDD